MQKLQMQNWQRVCNGLLFGVIDKVNQLVGNMFGRNIIVRMDRKSTIIRKNWPNNMLDWWKICRVRCHSVMLIVLKTGQIRKTVGDQNFLLWDFELFHPFSLFPTHRFWGEASHPFLSKFVNVMIILPFSLFWGFQLVYSEERREGMDVHKLTFH